jgi:hypothetical protein
MADELRVENLDEGRTTKSFWSSGSDLINTPLKRGVNQRGRSKYICVRIYLLSSTLDFGLQARISSLAWVRRR